MSCQCGCGQETPIAYRNRKELGHKKGEPIPFLPGHANRGKKRIFSDEWKKNISQAAQGRVPWNKGVPWTEKVKEKLRGPRDSILGDKNPNWKGGIDKIIRGERRSREYRRWKQAIRQRDKVCIVCGSSERLQAHHIKSFTRYPELRFDITNGQLLCWNCHRKTDNFGNKES